MEVSSGDSGGVLYIDSQFTIGIDGNDLVETFDFTDEVVEHSVEKRKTKWNFQ